MKPVLPQNYTYLITNFKELSSYRTQENFEIVNFELETFVNVFNEEDAQKWLATFQSWSKTTMAETKGFGVKGKKVLFRKLLHCIHSNQVKKKQGNREMKRPNSSRARNIDCTANIHLRLVCIYTYIIILYK